MEGPRPPLETEFPSVVKFLDSNLRPQESWSITSEYPTAFTESNRINIRIITERDQVLAHALIRPMVIKAPAGLFKVAGVGSVVTSTDHRNQGLSTKTITSCLEAASAQGCDFAILWTNLYDFYRKMDFELAGAEISALIEREIPIADTNLKFMEGNRIAPDAIHRLYAQHTVTAVRTIEEVRRYLQIPNSRIYTAWDQHGQLKAYAVEGKGADLNGYIHEWGGSVSALMSLFAHIRKAQSRPVTIIIPSHSRNLLRALEEQRVLLNRGYLGMLKLLNCESLFSKIKRHARSLGVSDLVLERQEDGKFLFGAGEQVFMTDSERDIVKLIFGPQQASEIHKFDKDAATVLERVFPLPLWIWGWDSI